LLGWVILEKKVKSARTVPVLMYHHVSPVEGSITTSPERFDEQLAALAGAGYTTLTAAQFAGFMQGQPVPEKSILITFDDGYLDNWIYADPILKKYGMKAVLFLVTSWAHEGPCRPQMGAGTLPDMLSHRQCMDLVAAGGNTDLMTARWSEVMAMDATGFEVHSHTHTHTRWDKRAESREIKSEQILSELEISKKILEAKTGHREEHICWPQGFFDSDYVQAARQAGYVYFYTTDQFGFNKPFGNPEHIYRIPISNRSGSWVVRRVNLSRNLLVGALFNRFKKWKRGFRKQSD